MKYTDAQITFSEFPDEISLCINISNCPFHCPGCHSPELWEDVGTELTFDELDKLINSNKGITLVGFMGGNLKDVNIRAFHIIMNHPKLKIGWYTGLKELPKDFDPDYFDYIKIGPYIEELGGLNNPNTNQRMYHYTGTEIKDITYKFWKHGSNN